MRQNNVSTLSAPSLTNRKFSHIYVEERAREYPDTRRILSKFTNANVVFIDDFRALFNRHGQHFQIQKSSAKLILAVKPDQLLYPGSSYAPNFGATEFYYNTLILNCVYNCDYCYLQGMYTSGNIVIFVNHDDFLAAASALLEKTGSLYLCISYDTDLLAFENIIPNCRRWIKWAENKPGALIEIRTKSTNFAAIADLPPPQNTILAWTLSPSSVVTNHEKKTPSLNNRLLAINTALTAGWKVRICFDPILQVNNWKNVYQTMIDEVFSTLSAEKVFDFSIGVFRMNANYLERIRKARKDSPILFYPYTKQDQLFTYNDCESHEIISFIESSIREYHPKAKIFNLLT